MRQVADGLGSATATCGLSTDGLGSATVVQTLFTADVGACKKRVNGAFLATDGRSATVVKGVLVAAVGQRGNARGGLDIWINGRELAFGEMLTCARYPINLRICICLFAFIYLFV